MEYVQFQGIFTSFPIKMGPLVHTYPVSDKRKSAHVPFDSASICCRGFNYWIVVETVAGWTKDCSTPKVWGNHIFIYRYFSHSWSLHQKYQILLEVSERFHISLPKMKPILIIVKLHPQPENLKRSCDFFPGSGATSFTGFPEGGDGRSNGFGALTAMLRWRLCSLWFLLFA